MQTLNVNSRLNFLDKCSTNDCYFCFIFLNFQKLFFYYISYSRRLYQRIEDRAKCWIVQGGYEDTRKLFPWNSCRFYERMASLWHRHYMLLGLVGVCCRLMCVCVCVLVAVLGRWRRRSSGMVTVYAVLARHRWPSLSSQCSSQWDHRRHHQRVRCCRCWCCSCCCWSTSAHWRHLLTSRGGQLVGWNREHSVERIPPPRRTEIGSVVCSPAATTPSCSGLNPALRVN